MEVGPNTGSKINTGSTTTTARLSSNVQFTKTGTHDVWIRGYARTIELRMREDGMVVVKVVITKGSAYVSKGASPSESPRGNKASY